mgnify:CR=1 FL=1
MVRRRCIQLAFIALAAMSGLRHAAAAPAADAEDLARRGLVAEAMTVSKARMASHPDDVENLELYIDLLLNMGLSMTAEATFVERLRAAPDVPDNHYLLGRALVDVRYAREAFENALKLDPEHARSHMGVAAVHSGQGRLGDAEAAYRRALSYDPTLSEAWLGLVRTYAQAGQTDRAAQAASDGLAKVPDDPGLALAVARLQPERAGPVLSSAVQVTPSDVPLLVAWASHLLQQGGAQQARDAAAAALAIEPADPDARRVHMLADEIATGRLSLAQANDVEAHRDDAAHLDAVLQAAPRSAVARLARAQLHHSAGDDAAALALLQEAVDTNPRNLEASAMAGQAWLKAGDANRAASLLERAMAGRPWDAETTLTLAAALMEQGMKARAIGLLGELAGARPYHTVAQVHYAQALVDSGRATEAYDLLKVAMQRLPDPRLAAAFIMIAPEAGHAEEAAALMEVIAEQTGNDELAEKAAKLRNSP